VDLLLAGRRDPAGRHEQDERRRHPSATIVDFAFGLVLLVSKEWSRIPMSTTWVFLGLLAAREIAMSVRLKARPLPETLRLFRGDGARVFAGLAVSVLLALALPWLGALDASGTLGSAARPMAAPAAPVAAAAAVGPTHAVPSRP
jgi:hypothetical protein